MAQPRSKKRSTRNGKNRLKQPEFRDKQSRHHHHTTKNMESGDPSRSGEPQKHRRSSSPSRKPRSDQSDQGSSLGNLAQSIADRPGILLAAAAAAGAFLMSRWVGQNGWLHHSLGRGANGLSFIPGRSWAEAQVPADRSEANTREPAQHTGIDPSGINSEAGFEVAQANQQNAAEAGDQVDRVEGTAVYDLNGQQIGRIRRLMIAKVGGRVLYAVMEFGVLLGIGTDEYAIPWSKLEYDTTLEGYRTDITQEQLQNAPEFARDLNHDRSDQRIHRDLPHYYEVPITGLRADRPGQFRG